MKKNKNILKNKKGDFAIFALIIIPTFLIILTSVLTANYRKTAIETKCQTLADNISLAASCYYANVIESPVNNTCFFSDQLLGEEREEAEKIVRTYNINETVDDKVNTFVYLLQEYLKTADGANCFWQTSLILKQEDGIESLEIRIYYIFPKISNSMAVLDTIGIENSGSSWYDNHEVTWSNMQEKISTCIASLNTVSETETYYSESEWKKIENVADVIAGVAVATTSCL